MGVRSRIGNGLVRVGKAFTGAGAPPRGGAPVNTPAAMQQAAADISQMGFEHTFAPGFPIGPYDGYQRHPRQQDFTTGYNIATRPRTFEALSFDTLKGLVTSYDVAQIVIRHRIDSLRSLDWKLVAADGYDGDVSGAIATGMAALKKPDRENYFDAWFAMWLRDVLSYDAGCLYRLRNNAGRCVGLMVTDGTTIAPLLDYWGQRPQPPAEAYVQYVQGLPWNWLTQDDLIYQPFWAQAGSPYGHAPIEDILLNANTDIRFQLYFLQRFTDGNLPAAFASAPETWTPDQITQFQGWWDSFMYGDQSRKSQVRWIPGGSSFVWSNEKDFTDQFSLFLMRKTCASYAVVPSDLGFTEDVNRSSGESQADVQHRVGDLPLIRYAQRILDGFLQDDLGLPVKFQFDLGEEQVDQAAQAQADQIYMQMAVVGASEIRQMRYGLAEPQGRPVPRFVYTQRAGPIPLNSLLAVAGDIDPATGAPAPGAVLPRTVFGGVPALLPNPPVKMPSLAEQEFGEKAMPPAPPPQPQMPAAGDAPEPPAPVAKDGEGITSAAGLYSEPLLRDGGGDEDAQAARQAADAARDQAGHEDASRDMGPVAKEMAAFRRYARARRKAGSWRDFRFAAVDAAAASALNEQGRVSAAKASLGPPASPQAVYDQLARNYRPEGIAWVLDAAWYGPADIPLGMIHDGTRGEWAASEPGANTAHVHRFEERIEDGGGDVRPDVLVKVPGHGKLRVVDGHHRYEADDALGVPVRAYTGIVAADGPDAPWAKTHLYQVHSGGDPLNKSAGGALCFLLCRARDDGGKMRYLLQKRAGESPHPGTWGLPGGHAHAGEDLWDAAVREASEEMGALPPLARGPALARDQDGQPVHTFLAQLGRVFTPDMAAAETPGESAGWGWFSRREVAALDLHPAMRETWGQLAAAGLLRPAADWSPVSKAAGLGKLTHAEAGYRAASGPRRCGDCAMFSDGAAGPSCELVQDPVAPGGVCGRWQPAVHIPSGGTLGGTALYKAASGYGLSPRSGMISLDLPEGTIEPVPGGVPDHHVTVVYLGPDVDDEAFAAACQRAREAAAAVPGPLSGTVSGAGCFAPSGSSDGKTPAWAAIAVPGAESLRSALEDLSASEFTAWQPHVTLAYLEPGDPLPAPLEPVPVTFTCLSVHRGADVARYPFGPVAKAGDAGPKDRRRWAGWDHDLRAAGHWGVILSRALARELGKRRAREMAAAWLAAGHAAPPEGGKREAVEAAAAWAAAWLAAQGADLSAVCAAHAPLIVTDGWLIGAASAAAAADGGDADWGGWQPGDTARARDRAAALGLAAGLSAALDLAGPEAGEMTAGYVTRIGRALVDALAEGDGPAAAGARVFAALSDEGYAHGSVLAQLLRAAAAAAKALYLSRRVRRLDWVTEGDGKVCAACLGYAAAGPYRAADAPGCPAHPGCRCALMPE